MTFCNVGRVSEGWNIIPEKTAPFPLSWMGWPGTPPLGMGIVASAMAASAATNTVLYFILCAYVCISGAKDSPNFLNCVNANEMKSPV